MNPKRPVKVIVLMVLAITAVIAVNASAAQAKYVILLNGASVNLVNLILEPLHVYFKAENGLLILCNGGAGTEHLTITGGGTGFSYSYVIIFTNCKWIGSEKTCTITDGESPGKFRIEGSGTVSMNATSYTFTSTSAEFGTVFTEGAFCTIPEEEVLSGTLSRSIPNSEAESSTTVKTSSLKADNLKLGNSKVTECVGQIHERDAGNPNATLRFELTGL